MQRYFPEHTPLILTEALRPYIGWMIKETGQLRHLLARPGLSAAERAALRLSLENFRRQISEFEEYTLSIGKNPEKHAEPGSGSGLRTRGSGWTRLLRKFFSLPER